MTVSKVTPLSHPDPLAWAEESGCILKTLYADPFAWAGESIVPVAHDFQRSFYTDLIRWEPGKWGCCNKYNSLSYTNSCELSKWFTAISLIKNIYLAIFFERGKNKIWHSRNYVIYIMSGFWRKNKHI